MNSVKERDLRVLSEYRDALRAAPRLMYLFFELTDCCNMRCLHCGSHGSSRGAAFLPLSAVEKTLDSVARRCAPERVMVCLTGGEPLLHPDFNGIAAAVRARGFPWGITTNGTLIDNKAAAALRSNGVGSVTVSLDGLGEKHDAFRCCPGAFTRAVEGVGQLLAAGISTQITTVVHKGNLADLEDIYGFVRELGVKSWRVINIEPMGRALEHPKLMLSYADVRALLDFIRDKRFSPETDMEVCYGCSHYLSGEYERTVRDNYFICGSGIYVGSVLCGGEIFSCLDIERRPELIQGNVATDDFMEVWENRFGVFRQDRTVLDPECAKCDERRLCGGDSAHTWDYSTRHPRFCAKKL